MNGMNDKNKNTPDNVSDHQLEDVVGGFPGTAMSGLMGKSAIPELITSNRGTYSSGSEPKYQVGQRLGIQCRYRGEIIKIPCMVRSVSASADLGIFYEEFGYTVEILCDFIPGLQGKIAENVYESCLYQ